MLRLLRLRVATTTAAVVAPSRVVLRSHALADGRRTMAGQPVVTAASIRAHRLKSAAGIAPIDVSGEMTLMDDSGAPIEEVDPKQPRQQQQPKKRQPLWGAKETTETPQVPRVPRSLHPSEAEDLSVAPEVPASTTHSSHPRPADNFERLSAKSPWKAARPPRVVAAASEAAPASTGRSNGWARQGAPVDGAEGTPGFESLKRGLPSMGWAEAHRASGSVPAAQSSPPSPEWTDADFLLLFPHLRTVRASSADDSQEVDTVAPKVEATAEQLKEIVADVRRKYPELEKLHLSSTWIKVRKWRELLGATRAPDAAASASSSSSSVAPALPSGFPSNALHPRFLQADIFMTEDEVSALLLRERDLLYLTIETAVVPKLNTIRMHLPGVNLSAVLRRNPSLLLSDLRVSLPLKVNELKALFPEISVVSIVEADARILNHAASSYLVPRLNLFAAASKYAPRHVLQFMAVEYPHVMHMRWNRMKRVEIVREPQFWTWWNQKQGIDSAAPVADATEATTTEADATTTSLAPVTVNDPASLPFSLYADLIMMPQEEFGATFPWFTMQFTAAEKELFNHRNRAKKGGAKVASDAEATSSLAGVSPQLLASVPGHPQSLSQALGLSAEAGLSADEARAKRRMDYLALKAEKADKRAGERAFMREREADHQRKKMSEYTDKFQAIRARGGLTTERDTEEDVESRGEDYSTKKFGGSERDSSSRGSSSRGGFQGRNDRSAPFNNQKNRAGQAAASRHASHAPGRVESFGARPTGAATSQWGDAAPPAPTQRDSFGSSFSTGGNDRSSSFDRPERRSFDRSENGRERSSSWGNRDRDSSEPREGARPRNNFGAGNRSFGGNNKRAGGGSSYSGGRSNSSSNNRGRR